MNQKWKKIIMVQHKKLRSEDIPCSNNIGTAGTKPDNRWKLEASRKFTIMPAYNKGPYMVVNSSDLKTAGKKI